MTFRGSLERNARFGDYRRVNLGGSLVRNARFADFKCEFLRKSRAKRLFWRLDE